MIQAEFVLLEVNGLFTYTYSLTASTALCRSQPQNWTTIMSDAGDKGLFSWNREVALTLPQTGPSNTLWVTGQTGHAGVGAWGLSQCLGGGGC